MSGYQTLNEAYLSVYEGFVPLNKDKEERVINRFGELGRRQQVMMGKIGELKKTPFLMVRPKKKTEMLATAHRALELNRLQKNAGNSLIQTNVHKLKELDKGEPKNKIVKLRREELEFVLDYLFENGYADNYESAAVIAESMSDEWFEDILCEWDWEHLKKHSLSNQPTHITGKTPPVLKPSDFENPDSDEAKAKKERRKARQKRLEFEVR